MKHQRTTFPRVRNILGILFIGACGMIQFSCKKSVNNDMPSRDDLAEAADVVKGTVLHGSLTSESDDHQIGITYNSGQKYIILDKLAAGNTLTVNIPSAGLILSDYGVIIKDESKNSYLLLAINDPKSILQFKAVESRLNGSIQRVLIYGVTVVNSGLR